jgi:uncharacterized protein involved in exopolysaccharide biosynthesis
MTDEDPNRGRMPSTMPTMRELAMVLFRQRRVFVWISGLVLVLAILYALFGTSYRAEMKILVRRGRAEAPVSAGENAPLDLTRTAITEEELNSEVELLKDDEVLRKVAEEAGVGGHDWFRILHLGEGRAQQVERAERRLAKNIEVQPVKKANLIAIRFAASDPQAAARVLRILAAVYLEKHMTVHRPIGEFRFYEQQTEQSRKKLDDSQRALLNFTSSHRVIAAGEHRDLALQKLSELESRGRETRIEISETQQRVKELGEQVSKQAERTVTQMRTADNPELLKALKSELLDLQIRRAQLLTKFEPSHRLVQEIEQQIVLAKNAIAAEGLTPVRDETTDKNPQHEWAISELQKAQVQLNSLLARQREIFWQESSYRGTAETLGHDAVTQDDLVASEKAARENYLLYVKKQEEARMNDALDERGIVNVAIAEEPVAPALPVWSIWMILAVGFAGAGAAGVGAAFTADYFDPAFRNPEDVFAYLDAPVLASFPQASGGRLSA